VPLLINKARQMASCKYIENKEQTQNAYCISPGNNNILIFILGKKDIGLYVVVNLYMVTLITRVGQK